LVSGVGTVLALDNPVPSDLPEDEPIDVFGFIFDYAAAIAATIAVLMIVIAAIMWMTSGGDDDKITTARKMLVWAIIGLIVVGLAYGIAAVVTEQIFT